MVKEETLEGIRYLVGCVCEWVSGDCEPSRCPFEPYCGYGKYKTDDWGAALDEVARLIAAEQKSGTSRMESHV